MSLALTESKQLALRSNSHTTSEHTPQSGEKLFILYAKQPMENHREQTPDEKVLLTLKITVLSQ